MKWTAIVCTGLFALFGLPSAEAREYLPVEVTDGRDVRLSGVSAERDEAGARVRGWVRRRAGSHGPTSAHLHVAVVDTAGNTLRTIETGWNGTLPSGIRGRRAAPFRAEIDPILSAAAAIVRVSVQTGSRHGEGNAD